MQTSAYNNNNDNNEPTPPPLRRRQRGPAGDSVLRRKHGCALRDVRPARAVGPRARLGPAADRVALRRALHRARDEEHARHREEPVQERDVQAPRARGFVGLPSASLAAGATHAARSSRVPRRRRRQR